MPSWISIPFPEWTTKGLTLYFQEHTAYALVLLLLLVNLIFVFLLFFRVLSTRSIKRRMEKRELLVANRAEDILSEYIGGSMDLNTASGRIMKLFRLHQINEITICTTFLQYYEALTGAADKNLKTLSSACGLPEVITKYLKRRKSPHLLLFIELASAGRFDNTYEALHALLDHKDRTIRFQALCTLVEIFRYDALNHILRSGFRPNEWEEMILLEKLLVSTREQHIDLKPFFRSGNEQIIRLALRIAEHFNRFDIEEELAVLFSHPSELLRRRVYAVAATLLMNGLQSSILEQYSREDFLNRVAILEALGRMGDREAIPFLENIFLSKTTELSILAGKTIKNILNSTDELKIIAGDDEQLIAMTRHINDPLLQ